MALPFYYNPATNEFESTIESLGTRFGLNEISTRAKTLSPTNSHTAESILPFQFDEISIEEMEDLKKQVKFGPQVKDGGRIGFSKGTDAVREYLSTLEPGTEVQPLELANKYKINRKNLYTILEKEFPQLKLLGRKKATQLVQKILAEKRLKTPVEIPTVISKLRSPGKNLTRDYVDIRWPNDKIKKEYIEDFEKKRSGTKTGTAGLSNEQLAKKYFGKVNNTTRATVERMNNVLQKKLDIKYKEGDPKEFIKKRKRRLSIVQGGKYIGGTEKFPFHHIMPIGGETAITTKDVTIISKLMNSKLAPYNKKLNDIADAVSNLYTERPDGFQKRIDQLQTNAEQIINKVKNELPKKYQGLIGFTKLEPIYDEYGTILRLQANRIGIDEAKSIAGVTGKAEEIGTMSSKRLSEIRNISLPKSETIGSKAWKGTKALGNWGLLKPIAITALPAVAAKEGLMEIWDAVKEKRLPNLPDLSSPETWMKPIFWHWATNAWGFDKTLEYFGKTFKDLSKRNKARLIRNVIANAGLKPHQLLKIRDFSVPWLAATVIGKSFTESETGAFRKEGENIFKGMETKVLPSMIMDYHKKYESDEFFEKEYGMKKEDYKSELAERYRKDPDDLKAIAQRNRNVPSLSKQLKNWIFKKEYSDYTNDKDDLAMGGIASLIK